MLPDHSEALQVKRRGDMDEGSTEFYGHDINMCVVCNLSGMEVLEKLKFGGEFLEFMKSSQ